MSSLAEGIDTAVHHGPPAKHLSLARAKAKKVTKAKKGKKAAKPKKGKKGKKVSSYLKK